MSDMFSDLASLGFKNLDNLDILEEEEKKSRDKKSAVKKEEEHDYEAEALFDKTMNCPCCYKDFTSRTVRTGKVKAAEPDLDLRPRYEKMDPLKYDAIVCPECGYASLSRFYGNITDGQKKLIREQISQSFKGIDTSQDRYSYDDAIMRHKLALLNTIVKKGKNSERAFTCLKIAWLYRGKAESELLANKDADVTELQKEEMSNLNFAYEGFCDSFSKEAFPICGMDQTTLMYLLADLARRLGEKDAASRWISNVITTRGISNRIKDKALHIKELLKD
ncbi:MAG: DUF2225 domain-containing protein [Lachnospiraceae bacterium]|nr:DUF2225 domain-containing protein [Lachnospiraceae bacterium]